MKLTDSGLFFDRQWAVVNAKSGRFLSQRNAPKLSQIQPRLPMSIFTSSNPEFEINDIKILLFKTIGKNVIFDKPINSIEINNYVKELYFPETTP